MWASIHNGFVTVVFALGHEFWRQKHAFYWVFLVVFLCIKAEKVIKDEDTNINCKNLGEMAMVNVYVCVYIYILSVNFQF